MGREESRERGPCEACDECIVVLVCIWLGFVIESFKLCLYILAMAEVS